jgi:hypothetical protein
MLLANGMGLGKPIAFGGVLGAAWFGLPLFAAPVFRADAMMLIAPVAIILVAENLGHIKAVSAMTHRDLDRYMGRAFVGDGVATMLAGSAGGTGVTTYAENIGVMAVTKIYSTVVFVVAALIAILLGFSPKFGALIQTIPGPVLGGVSIVVFGLIAVAGARIWVENGVDFGDNRNLIVAAVTLVLGAGDFTVKLGNFTLGGIGTATFGALILYALLRQVTRRAPGLLVALRTSAQIPILRRVRLRPRSPRRRPSWASLRAPGSLVGRPRIFPALLQPQPVGGASRTAASEPPSETLHDRQAGGAERRRRQRDEAHRIVAAAQPAHGDEEHRRLEEARGSSRRRRRTPCRD